MMDFIIATNTPGKVKDWLIDRGIGQMVDLGNGGQVFQGTRRGLKFTASGIPNPVEGNSLKMFLFRFAYEMEADDDDDTIEDGDRFKRSKFANWVKTNGTKVEFNRYSQDELDGILRDENGDILRDENGDEVTTTPKEQVVITAWRVPFDGGQFYITKDIETIGVWQ